MLGPLLFVLYINDIVNTVEGGVQIRLFADDCVLFKDIVSLHDQTSLCCSLNNILAWCGCWGMTLNTDKSVLLRMTHKKSPLLYTYKLGPSPLREVTSYKYLGVTLNNSLSWNDHITNTCASAFRKLCLLRHKLKKAPPNVKMLCYISLIRPKLEYACIVWDPYTKTNINSLERIQRKAVRFIFNKFSRCDSPTELMKINNLEPLELRRKNRDLNSLNYFTLTIYPLTHLNIYRSYRPELHATADMMH